MWIVGFGSPGETPQAKRRVLHVPVRDWGCDTETASARGCLPDLELVLPRLGGLDTCHGDSGGPVLERDAQGILRVVAITSRAVRDSVLECGDGGIYVRVDALQAWMTRALAAHFKRLKRQEKKPS